MPRALVMSGPADLTVRELDVASLAPHDVQVRIVAAGVCHSDLHAFERDGLGLTLPCILGHEGAGIVQAVGTAVRSLEPGDHVILAVVPVCGRCAQCRAGLTTLCVQSVAQQGINPGPRLLLDGKPVRQMADLGTWSEVSVVHEQAAVKIDPAMPLPPAALIGCAVVTGFGGTVNVAKARPGMSLAAIGCGGVGLCGVQGARIAGADRIIAIDTVPLKLEYARKMGATDTVNASQVDDVVSAVKDLTGGEGVDAAVDFVGTESTVRQALGMCRLGGTAVITGLASGEYQVSAMDIIVQAKTLTGNYMGMGDFRQEFPKLVDMYMNGQLLLDEMISRTIGIDEIHEAFRAMQAGEVARTIIQL